MMHRNGFGNLEEWGRVLERLSEMTRDGRIDEHQDELAVLLRYRDNWRLREAALESIRAVRRPREPLIRELCAILMNEGLYHQVRVLAAEALAVALDRLAASAETAPVQLQRDIREQMHELLDSGQPPVIHQAARRVLPRIE